MTTVRVLLNTREAADRLRVTPGTMRNWRSYGTGPAWIGSGKSTRYDVDVLDQWLATGADRSPKLASSPVRHDVPSKAPPPRVKLVTVLDTLPADVAEFVREQAIERKLTPADLIRDWAIDVLVKRIVSYQ